MKIKRWMWKRFLMLLGALVWRLDDWVHTQQAKLREELQEKSCRRARLFKEFRGERDSAPKDPAAEIYVAGYCISNVIAGVAPASKKEARRRKERLTAAMFDRRFIR